MKLPAITKSMVKRNRTRHSFLWIICSLSLLLLTSVSADAQDSLKVIHGETSNNTWMYFSDAPNALYHHLTGQAFQLLDQREDTIAAIQSLSGWKARQQKVKATLKDIVGPFPEKTPLNATITGTIDKEEYRVEHIVYESQPGFHVTSSLFIPDGLDQPAPAIIYASGHTSDGYRSPTYQHVILNLVKKGFVVFAFDPVGQGERVQYYDTDTGESMVGGSTNQHSYPGAQAFIAGSSLAKHMAWDGIRAVDYLFSRSEVDSSRIGMTGRSGGGTQTAYTAALDERIYAAAPESYITNFTRLLQSDGPQDGEQLLYHEISSGIDHADLLSVRAPKPALMLTTTRDFFSIQGARETAREVAKIYWAYGKPDHFRMVTDDNVHASTLKNREAMYGFFQQQLDNSGSPQDQQTEPLSPQQMQVTRTGQVSTSLDSENVFSLNRQRALQQIQSLQASRESLNEHVPNALKSAGQLSGYREPKEVGEPVFAGRYQKEEYAIEKYFIMGEGNYPIPYLLMVPDRPNGKGLLYLHSTDKAAEATGDGQMVGFVNQGFTVLAPDLLGIGEMGPGDFRGDSYIEDTAYGLWFASVLTGRSIVGTRAGDIIRLGRVLQERKQVSEVYGMALRQMGPALLHAAAFDSSISRIALWKPYSSYRSIVMNRLYEPSFIPGTVAGALPAYDLPDLAASLAPRKLLLVGITDGAGQAVQPEALSEDLAVIKAAYRKSNARGQLHIIAPDSMQNPQDLLQGWAR